MAESTTLQMARVRAPRAQGVQGFAALGNGDHQILRADHGLAVAEFAGQIHLAGNAGHVLDEELAD
jgi:hypothetical protein